VLATISSVVRPPWFATALVFAAGVAAGVLWERASRPEATTARVPGDASQPPRTVAPLLAGSPVEPLEAATSGREAPRPSAAPDATRDALFARIREAGGGIGVEGKTKSGRPQILWTDPGAPQEPRDVVALSLPAGASELLADVAAFPRLRMLRFEGADHEIDLASLPVLPGLERIVFESVRARASGLAPLARQERLSRVDFSDTSLDPEAVRAVGALSGLRSLTLDSGRVTDETLAALAGATRLERLDLDDALVTDAGLAHLSAMVGLKDLVLTGTRITGEGFRHLSGLTSLERVVLDKARVTDEGLRHLAALPALRSLDVEATDVTDAGLEHLVRSPTLVELVLEGTRITDRAFDALGRIRTLRALSVLNTPVTAAGLAGYRRAHPEVEVEE
jgi:hypothetical protein